MISDSTSLEGQFLVAMPRMGDARFEKTIVYICAHSSDGAMGFIINKVMNEPNISDFLEQLKVITLKEKSALSSEIKNTNLLIGGPVEPGRGFVLHSADYKVESTLRVDDMTCLTATLEILRELAMGRGPNKFSIALGYSGWSAGQLEEEISANGWLVCPADQDIIYDDDYGSKYIRVMGIMGINPLLISADTGHA